MWTDGLARRVGSGTSCVAPEPQANRLNSLCRLHRADGGLQVHRMVRPMATSGSRERGTNDLPLWLGLAVLPLAGLVLLLIRPELDVIWEHHPGHFWLVLFMAVVNAVMAVVTNEASLRRRDARLLLVSLAFLVAAGFLGLHALATPGVLVPRPMSDSLSQRPSG
jgi:hypothetical protein